MKQTNVSQYSHQLSHHDRYRRRIKDGSSVTGNYLEERSTSEEDNIVTLRQNDADNHADIFVVSNKSINREKGRNLSMRTDITASADNSQGVTHKIGVASSQSNSDVATRPDNISQLKKIKLIDGIDYKRQTIDDNILLNYKEKDETN